MDILYSLGIMMVLAAIFAIAAYKLRQPLILGYVVAGIMIGPTFANIIPDPLESLTFFAEFSLILLLFIIGLELDFKKIKTLGTTSIIIGTAQVVVITAVVAGLSLLMGIELIPAIYIGLIVAFSSTIVIVKLLTEKKELDTEHGNMILGILIVEDILAVIGLTILGVLAQSGETQHLIPTLLDVVASVGVPLPQTPWFTIGMIFVNGALFVIASYLITRYILPAIMDQVSSSTELLFATSLSVALILGAVGGFFGFSLAIGAFVAGIVLSSATYRHEVMGKMKPLKDFFLVLFFVSLGTILTFDNIRSQVPLLLFLLGATLIIKPILIFFIRKLFRYNNRISFLIGAGMAQISEFSLLLAIAGVAQGVLTPEFMTTAVIATLLSMMLTAYIIQYDSQLFAIFKPLLLPLEGIFGSRKQEVHHAHEKEIGVTILIGANNIAHEAIETLEKTPHFLLVDRNPRRLSQYQEKGVRTLCTDIYNLDLYTDLVDFSKAKTVISTVNNVRANIFLLEQLKELGITPRIIVTAKTESEATILRSNGFKEVITPQEAEQRLLFGLLRSRWSQSHIGIGHAFNKELERHLNL